MTVADPILIASPGVIVAGLLTAGLAQRHRRTALQRRVARAAAERGLTPAPLPDAILGPTAPGPSTSPSPFAAIRSGTPVAGVTVSGSVSGLPVWFTVFEFADAHGSGWNAAAIVRLPDGERPHILAARSGRSVAPGADRDMIPLLHDPDARSLTVLADRAARGTGAIRLARTVLEHFDADLDVVEVRGAWLLAVGSSIRDLRALDAALTLRAAIDREGRSPGDPAATASGRSLFVDEARIMGLRPTPAPAELMALDAANDDGGAAPWVSVQSPFEILPARTTPPTIVGGTAAGRPVWIGQGRAVDARGAVRADLEWAILGLRCQRLPHVVVAGSRAVATPRAGGHLRGHPASGLPGGRWWSLGPAGADPVAGQLAALLSGGPDRTMSIEVKDHWLVVARPMTASAGSVAVATIVADAIEGSGIEPAPEPDWSPPADLA